VTEQEQWDKEFDSIVQGRIQEIVTRHREEGTRTDADRRLTGGGRRAGEFDLGMMRADLDHLFVAVYRLTERFNGHDREEEADRKRQQEKDALQTQALNDLTKVVQGMAENMQTVETFNKTIDGLDTARKLGFGFIAGLATLAASLWAIVEHGRQFLKFFGKGD